MQITGGKVSFRRVVQPAQYESKEGLVELSFAIAEGEGDKAQAFLDATAQMAQAKALELVGLKPATTAKPKLEVVETFTNTAQKDAAAARMNAKDAKGKDKAPKADTKKPADELGDLPEAKPQISTNPEDRKPPADPDGLDGLDTDVVGEVPKEITDVELRDAVSRWVAANKNSVAVKELRAQFAGPPPKGLNDIPQAKRQAFLAELNKLPAKAA